MPPRRRVARVFVLAHDVEAVDLLQLKKAGREDLDRGLFRRFWGWRFGCGRGLLFRRRQIGKRVEALLLFGRFFRGRRYRRFHGFRRLDVDGRRPCEESGALQAF